MGWELSGELIESCTCKLVCPCIFGPATPDRGWCSGALTFAIGRGSSGGVDLSGRTVTWLVDLPTDFVSGNATARLYLDDGGSADQRRELESIFQGKQGGPWELIGNGIVSKWMPTRAVKIAVQKGDQTSVTVGDFGRTRLQMIKGDAQKQARVLNPPAMAALAIDALDLADSNTSGWSDPEMRQWQNPAGSYGQVSHFHWKV